MKSKSLLDPSFVYVPSVETDLRKTFARIHREQRKQQPETKPAPPLPFTTRRIVDKTGGNTA